MLVNGGFRTVDGGLYVYGICMYIHMFIYIIYSTWWIIPRIVSVGEVRQIGNPSHYSREDHQGCNLLSEDSDNEDSWLSSKH